MLIATYRIRPVTLDLIAANWTAASSKFVKVLYKIV